MNRRVYLLIIFISGLHLSCQLQRNRTPAPPLYVTRIAQPNARPLRAFEKMGNLFYADNFYAKVDLFYKGKMSPEELYRQSQEEVRQLNLNHFSKLNKAVFFQSQIDSLPSKTKHKITGYLNGIVDSIVKENLGGPFCVDFLIRGFSEEISFSKKLSDQLKNEFQIDGMSSAMYYQLLSFKRSYQVSEILHHIIRQRLKSKWSSSTYTIRIITQGMGNMLPDSNKVYDLQDERRRVVKLYIRPGKVE